MLVAIGVIEFNSIANGINATDIMLKAADVQLIDSYPICAGKYMSIISGEVGAVKSAINAVIEQQDPTMVNYLIIPNIHEKVIPAINMANPVPEIQALGIVETFSVATTIKAADAAVKAALVDLIEVRLARGLGGKGYLILTGLVGAVKAAVAAAEAEANSDGLLMASVIIPSPHEDLKERLL